MSNHPRIKLLPPGTKVCPICGAKTQTIARITGYLSYIHSDNKDLLDGSCKLKNRWQKGKIDEFNCRVPAKNVPQ